MELSHVIIGSIVTEKAERQKTEGDHTYTLRVAPTATKIEIKKALEQFFNVEVASVRVMKVQPKTRSLGEGKSMEKRHAFRKAFVTLRADSKALDLANFHVQA